MKADGFPVVETPPWEQRFKRNGGTKVFCVVCGPGITGFKPFSEADESNYKSWWTHAHKEHVRCTCGAAVTRKGLGAHRGSMRRHGHPCPWVPGEPIVEIELSREQLVMWVRLSLR